MMSEVPADRDDAPPAKVLVFNRYGELPPPNDTYTDVYSDDPIVHLELRDSQHREAARQSTERLAAVMPDDQYPNLDPPLSTAYEGYTVGAGQARGIGGQGSGAANIPPPGERDRPPQPQGREARRERLTAMGRQLPHRGAPRERTAPDKDIDLYLFNVIVALEWQPDAEYLRQMEWAFRRASDFLYDVTDGRMAFGQVVFGGPHLMEHADIQIAASNRLNPRSWVGGLHLDDKSMPIRLGRGMWYGRYRVAIPWDEPEGYRTIIHEWGHYALNLRDDYLERRRLARTGADDLVLLPDESVVGAQYTAIIPRVTQPSESIMGTIFGVSELVARMDRRASLALGQTYEWLMIERQYPRLALPPEPSEGPGRLPLPLPRFVYADPQVQPHEPISFPSEDAAAIEVFGDLAEEVQPDRCWLYVLRYQADQPERVIAQGTLDARSSYRAFPLLGAREGDATIVIAEHHGRPPIVLLGAAGRSELAEWGRPVFPRIDVLPQPLDDSPQLVPIRVRVETAPGQPPPRRVQVFSLGAMAAREAHASWVDGQVWISDPLNVETLDGHVLVSWSEGSGGVTIATYSLGGGPWSLDPGPVLGGPSAITGGASDGTVMLFFDQVQPEGYDDDHNARRRQVEAKSEEYSKVRVVTTINFGLAHGSEALPKENARPRSHAYSIASNAPLPLELHPTLVMDYDQTDEAELQAGDLRTCRLVSGHWTPLPTYVSLTRSFAATPLAGAMAGSLLSGDATTRAEVYRVFWIPR
jgi:hypothetical protein